MTELAPVITLSDLVDRYDVFFVDQFGVLRDDKDAYPGAAETLRHLKSLGKTVVILSNSGRSGEYNAERFTKLGFSRDSFDVFMTSGDAAYAVLSSQGSPVANGASCFTISSGGDHNLADRLGLVSAMEPAEADLLIISGSEAEKVPMEAYEKILRTAVQRGIEAVCTNPDIHKLADGKTAPGAGAIALLYEKLGGKVRWFGKPHGEIYEQALRISGSPPRGSVVCIGDSVDHDILGAKTAGLSAVLVRTGIVSDLSDAQLAHQIRDDRRPDFIMQAFC